VNIEIFYNLMSLSLSYVIIAIIVVIIVDEHELSLFLLYSIFPVAILCIDEGSFNTVGLAFMTSDDESKREHSKNGTGKW